MKALSVRWLRMVCSTTRWARASAASTAARSPNALSSARLPGASGQSVGAPSASASITSVTAGSTLVLDRDRLGAVARSCQRLRHHHRHHFADIAHAADRKRKLVELSRILHSGVDAKVGNLTSLASAGLGWCADTDVAVGHIVLLR